MRRIVLFLLSIYQKILSPLLHQVLGIGHACRYSPTCSEYAKIHITREGIVKGGTKSLLRLLYCQPFASKLPIALRT
ncbi:MAG TPA: membrane protein insertion efficiency factor YidD [Patescibacteria group bacterium]|nr:membrane protein insertion efficiency factor YidD [Patescibacteria group bacterium]